MCGSMAYVHSVYGGTQPNIVILNLSKPISQKWRKIGDKLVLTTNRKSYGLSIDTKIGDLRPSMTLNGVMALILRYFTKFVYDVVVNQIGIPRFQNLLLIVYDHINTVYAIIQRLFGQNKRRQLLPPLQTVVAYAHVS